MDTSTYGLPSTFPRFLQWDAVEDKGTVAAYAAGAVVALWLSSTVVNAISAVPLVGAWSIRYVQVIINNRQPFVDIFITCFSSTMVSAISAVPLVGAGSRNSRYHPLTYPAAQDSSHGPPVLTVY